VNTITDNSLGWANWRRITLPASLVLNLFLMAVIGGHLLTNHVHRVNPDTPLARALANVDVSLSAREAATFRAAMLSDESHFADAAKQLVRARLELEKQIGAEPFDQAATKQALAAWRASWNRFMDDFDDPLVHALGQISPDGRHRLVVQRRQKLGPVVP
jgi:uncharacterized membrane protein